jgi:hypothetical protein
MSKSSVVPWHLGALFAASALIMMVLLVVHPHARVHAFPDMVEFEIRYRLVNGLVHGGAIALFLLLLAGHVALARLINTAGLAAMCAVTAFGAGCALITASLVLDGFVTPALALQYRAAQDLTVQHSAEALARFCGTNIRILMPMALLSFAASALAWCVPMVRAGGRRRLAGAASGVVGATVGVMISAAPPEMLDHAVLGSLFLVALWHLALAIALLKSDVPVASPPGQTQH